MNIEIEFDSLEQARERGPAVLVDRCAREMLRLLSQPTYCERDGRGVMSAEVAGPPPIIVTCKLEAPEGAREQLEEALRAALARPNIDHPAPSEDAEQPENDK